MRWSNGRVGSEGEAINDGGINPWDYEWTKCDEPPVELPHPIHRHQRHRYRVYRVTNGEREVTFAVGELSANVWGFYQRLD